MGACGRAGVEKVSLAFGSEVMSLVAVGLFGSVAGSPGSTGEVLVTLSVLLQRCVRNFVVQTRHL